MESGAVARRSVEAEVLDEIAFHLDMRTRENIRAGLEPDEAQRDAEERFGSVDRVIVDCLTVRMGGRIMLQRINLAMVVLLIGAVGFLGWRMYETSDRQASEIELMRLQVTELGKIEIPRHTPRVYLLGQIERSGAVAIHENQGLSLGQAVAQSGGFSQYARTSDVRILRRGADGRVETHIVDFSAIIAGESGDFALEADDIVHVPESIF